MVFDKSFQQDFPVLDLNSRPYFTRATDTTGLGHLTLDFSPSALAVRPWVDHVKK
jgi:hypothetical protein